MKVETLKTGDTCMLTSPEVCKGEFMEALSPSLKLHVLVESRIKEDPASADVRMPVF